MTNRQPRVTRRQFAGTLACGSTSAMALPLACADTPAEANDGQHKFSFLLLGDTHFDRIEHHDMAWMRQHYAKDIRQVENYCRLTREQLPKLLDAASQSLTTADPSAAFALHVGDLVEGICGNETLATRHCEEAWLFFKNAKLGVPLLITKGNHDVTGPGSIEAFANVLMRQTAKELGRERLDRSSYAFKQGENLFAVFDAYDRLAIDWLEQVTRENKFQRLFVLMHLPVVPYNARSNWRVYYHPQQADQRRRLVNLLDRHRAIVLCGHLHKYSLLVRRCETGRFAQLAISSILKERPAKKQPLGSVDDYGPDLTDLEPDFSVETVDVRKHILSSEKPFIEHFEYEDASGYAVISVDGPDVQATIFDGIDRDRSRQVSISKLISL